jgi:glycosyltransferase involved in cell wall biosynthesis
MHITVAICTWNRSALLAQTLDQMTRLNVARGVEWEVLVVNNNCTDDTDAVLAAASCHLPIRRVFEPTPGKSHALNRTLREARGDFILWTDDDVLVDERWLEAFTQAAARYPSAAVFGGPIEPRFAVNPEPDLLAAFPALAIGFCGLDHRRHEGPLPAGLSLWGANMACRRSALAGVTFSTDLGPLESSCRVGEDWKFVDLVRARGGEIVWAPTMKVRHYVPASRTTLQYLTRYYTAMGRTHVLRTGMPIGHNVFGVPRWVWRQYLVSHARYAFYSLWPIRARRLVWLRWLCFWTGVLTECRRLGREQRRDYAPQVHPARR